MNAEKTALNSVAFCLALLVSSTAAAQVPPPPPPPPPGPAGPPLDLRQLLKEVDTDADGCMSHPEWQRAGLPESAYSILKDGKGCVTLAKMKGTAPPPGLDKNGDGKLTAQEFRDFDKKNAPPGGTNPPSSSSKLR